MLPATEVNNLIDLTNIKPSKSSYNINSTVSTSSTEIRSKYVTVNILLCYKLPTDLSTNIKVFLSVCFLNVQSLSL